MQVLAGVIVMENSDNMLDMSVCLMWQGMARLVQASLLLLEGSPFGEWNISWITKVRLALGSCL